MLFKEQRTLKYKKKRYIFLLNKPLTRFIYQTGDFKNCLKDLNTETFITWLSLYLILQETHRAEIISKKKGFSIKLSRTVELKGNNHWYMLYL